MTVYYHKQFFFMFQSYYGYDIESQNGDEIIQFVKNNVNYRVPKKVSQQAC